LSSKGNENVESHDRYTPKALSEADANLAQMLRGWFMGLDEFLVNSVPEGRERALARTHLETASMYAVKAISHQVPRITPEAQETDWTTSNPDTQRDKTEDCRDLTETAQKIRAERGLPPRGERRS
jgi:hypothetical protein